MKLVGKVAIVTGGGGGIGGAQAQLFAEEGAAVCVADLSVERAQAVVDKITHAGGRAFASELDVRSPVQWQYVVDATERAFGPVTILCNNAGSNFRVGFDDLTEQMWNEILGSILTGSFLGIKAVVPSMRKAHGGVIANLGSLASVKMGAGGPAYGAAKMGLVSLTAATASAYAKDGIRCIIVSPGHVDTPFIRGNNPHSPNDERTSIDNPANYERRLRETPLGRLQTGDDVAKAVLFMVSDDASMITGSMLTVDGGAALK